MRDQISYTSPSLQVGFIISAACDQLKLCFGFSLLKEKTAKTDMKVFYDVIDW